jgi:hypothetical protein
MSQISPDNYPPELSAAIAAMLANPGVYVLTDTAAPEVACAPVVSQGGKIYAMRLDQELAPNRFYPTAKINGPFWPPAPSSA